MRSTRTRAFAVVALTAVALAGCGSSSKPASPPSTTTVGVPSTTQPSTTEPATLPPETIARAILLPAKVAPVSDECTLPVSNKTDGNVAPLLCPNGGVNRIAWAHYSRGKVRDLPATSSKTMQLGRDASATSAFGAMCSDYSNVYGTNPLTRSSEKLAAAYYGWTFTDSRVSQFDHQSCPATPAPK